MLILLLSGGTTFYVVGIFEPVLTFMHISWSLANNVKTMKGTRRRETWSRRLLCIITHTQTHTWFAQYHLLFGYLTCPDFWTVGTPPIVPCLGRPTIPPPTALLPPSHCLTLCRTDDRTCLVTHLTLPDCSLCLGDTSGTLPRLTFPTITGDDPGVWFLTWRGLVTTLPRL